MTFDNTSLEQKAERTLELIINAVIIDDFLSDIITTYHQEVEKPLIDSFGVKRKKPFNENDNRRILFEFICFATYMIMSVEAPKYIRKRKLFITNEPDVDKVRFYNTKLYDITKDYLNRNGFDNIREIILKEINPELKYEEGEVVNLTSRNAIYINCGDNISATKLFVIHLSYAIDADNSAFVEPISVFYAGSAIELARDIAKVVFI